MSLKSLVSIDCLTGSASILFFISDLSSLSFIAFTVFRLSVDMMASGLVNTMRPLIHAFMLYLARYPLSHLMLPISWKEGFLRLSVWKLPFLLLFTCFHELL